MKIVHLSNIKKTYMEKPLFTGKVASQTPVTDEEGSDLSINYIHFPKGVRNKFHKHSNDQILVVIKGHGIVATKEKEYKVEKGDVIWTPAGEVHRHGAAPKSAFSHISITKSHTKLTQVEE